MVSDSRRDPAATRRAGRIRLAILAAAVVAGAVVVVVFVTGGDGGTEGELNGDGFTLDYPPKDWGPISDAELAKQKGKPLAVVRQKAGKAYVIVRGAGAAPKSFTKFSGDLTTELKQRVPDFQKRTAKTIELTSGDKAFFYSYIRRKTGTVQTVVVVPAGDRSYTLNTVLRPGDRKVATQNADIILSFDPD